MIGSGTLGWQTVIADLALILFLVTASAVGNTRDKPQVSETPNPAVAQWEGGPQNDGFDEWLADQTPDARATMVLVGRYAAEDRDIAWRAAANNEALASIKFERVRTVLVPAAETGWSAQLVYDGQPTP